MVAYLIGCFFNNYIIARMQAHHKGKHMALRFAVGNAVGIFIDSLLFAGILNYTLIQSNTYEFITIIIVGFLIKWLYTVVVLAASVPLTVWLKRVIKNEKL